jgi:hypothetical protein
MTTILSLNDWFEIIKRGTSGDQVIDILYSWKAQADEWERGLAVQECEWEYQYEDGYYETKCGKSFYFNFDGYLDAEDQGKLQDDFKWCPCCGKVIKEMEYYDSSYDGLIPDEEVE